MAIYAEEHEELRSAARRLLEKSADSAAVRATIAEGGYDTALWRRMSDELGLPGLAIPEARGGGGFGVVELAVVLEEIGRANLPSPFLSTVLAGLALDAAGPTDVAGTLLPELAAGTLTAAVGVCPAGRTAPWRLDDATVSGTLPHVADGSTAEWLLLAGNAEGGVVDLNGPGVTRTALQTMDLTREQARVELVDAPVQRLSPPEGWLARVEALAAVLLSCEQVGGAGRVLEMSTTYASERVQFGRAIGSFQAVKHLLADMLVEFELARTVQQHAVGLAASPDTDPAALDAAARTARAASSRAFLQLTSDTVRAHGGIGYTWEHDAHLYFRRARASAVLFGDSATDTDRLATHAGLTPTASSTEVS